MVTSPRGRAVHEARSDFGSSGKHFIRKVILGIASALKYLHEKCICHFDVNPRNIINVGEDKKAVLIDFSIASYLRDSNEGVRKNFGGTRNYVHRKNFISRPHKLWPKKEAKNYDE